MAKDKGVQLAFDTLKVKQNSRVKAGLFSIVEK